MMDEREDLPMISLPEQTAETKQERPMVVKLPMRIPGIASKGFGKPTTHRRLMPAPPAPRPAVPAKPAPMSLETLQRRLDEQHRMLQDALQFNMRLTKERDELKAGTILLQQEMLKIRREAKMGAGVRPNAAPRAEAAPQDANGVAENAKLKSQVIALDRHLKGTLEKLGMTEAVRKRAEADRAEIEQRLAAAWAALQPRRPAPAPAPVPAASRQRPAVRPSK